MFYSHEVLTSRKYGVATVWLVATIGSKSNLKKVNRKAILDVDVQKACNTVIFPEAPMALRLQSSLLYGVSRVYSQQCGYVLTDAQKAQDAMRNLLRASRSNELDPDAGKARPEQLMLMDDPAFMPEDLALPALDFDLSDLDLQPGESQNSLLSPGPRRRASSDGSSRASSVPGLRLSHSSGNSRGTYQLPDHHDDPFAPMGSSAQKLPGLNFRLDDEEMGLEEVDWEFDGEGNEIQVQGSAPTFREKLLSGSAASGAVRRDHEEAQAARGAVFDEDGDFNMMGGDDQLGAGPQDLGLDPNAEAFPTVVARSKSRGDTAEDEFEPSSDGAIASQKKARKPRVRKTIQPDATLIHTNSEIRSMSENYLNNMKKDGKVKQDRHLKVVAKTNVKIWIFGDGIGGVGRGIGEGKIPGPLDMFSGDALMAAITGLSISDHSSSPKRNGSSPVADGSDAEGRRVRPRLGEDSDGIDMARGDDVQLPFNDDEGMDLEVGREAQDALDDHVSSMMPWNMSAGARAPSSSVRGGTGGRGFGSGSLRHSSVRGEHQYQLGSQIGRGVREGTRLTSASPLHNRGIQPLDHGSDDFIMGSDNIHDFDGEGRPMNTQERVDLEEFEVFGPGAKVDTQTAGQSQWIAEALDNESFNFMDYIKNIAMIKARAMGKGKGLATGNEGSVVFEELIPFGKTQREKDNTHVVAAQGFLHVLTLASKGLLRVKQEVAFGEIRMWAVGGVDEEFEVEEGRDVGFGGGGDDEGEDDVDELTL